MRKFAFILVMSAIYAFLVFSLSFGISEAPQQQRIKKFLKKEIKRYGNKDKSGFFKGISREYYPDFKDFQYDVENFLYDNSNIQMDFIVEKILTSGNTATVEIKWDKSYADRGGRPIKLTGRATLFFDVSRGRLLLKEIRGDNPFTR